MYGKKIWNVLIYLYFRKQNGIIFIVRKEKNKMKKKIILAVLLTTLLTGCGKTIPKLENGQEAVVTFKDGSMISVDDLYKEMKTTATSTLIQMIDTKLMKAKYEDKLDEAQENAKNQIDALKQMYGKDENGNYSETTFLRALQSSGYTNIEDYQEYLANNYLNKFVVEDYVKSIIKDKEIEDYYKNEIVGDRDVYHIQIIPEVSSTATSTEKTEAEEKALEEAKELIARLKKGESFEDLAKEASDDEATKEKGGSLGFINKGTYGSDVFDKEVYDLKVGEYSNVPIKTTSGYEIVYVKEEKEKKALDEVRDEIIDALVDKKTSEDATLQITALLELRKENGVEIIDSVLDRNMEKYMDSAMNYAKSQNSAK